MVAMSPSRDVCRHGIRPAADCADCNGATPAKNAVVPFAQLNQNERRSALFELVKEIGRDKTPAEILAVAAEHGMTGRGVTAGRITKMRQELGFPGMKGRWAGAAKERNGGGQAGTRKEPREAAPQASQGQPSSSQAA